MGSVIVIDYAQPQVKLDLWGGTSGSFDGMDRFGRIIDQRWKYYGSSPADLDRYKYGYDRDSNRQWKQNTVGSSLDEYYTYDNLNRLTSMQRGTLTGSPPTGISGTPVKEEDWTLDPTGNWSEYIQKTSGTTDLDQTRTSNTVNEITGISESTGPSWVDPVYDAAGNTTTFPQGGDPTQSYTATYDAWNRMVEVKAGANTVAKYKYDGRMRRIVQESYTGGTLSETRHFYFTNDWQDIEERVGTATTADVQYVWGIRYIDELVCRDDATPQRLYAMQDANFNVTGITNTSGAVQERYVYTPYGLRSIRNASWSIISSSSYDWVVGHQGLIYAVVHGSVYVRQRFWNVVLGTWQQRDPIGYLVGMSLYFGYGNNPIIFLDPIGLLLTLSDIAGIRDESQNAVDAIRQSDPNDVRLLFLDTQQCILDKLAKGACCTGSPAATDWLARVLQVFQHSLNNALSGKIAAPLRDPDNPTQKDYDDYNDRIKDVIAGKIGGPWWGIVFKKLHPPLNSWGGLNPNPDEAAAVVMMIAHINFDLKTALLSQGVGTNVDFKCIGDVVNACTPKRLGEFLTALGKIQNPMFDAMAQREHMRDEVVEIYGWNGITSPQTTSPYSGLPWPPPKGKPITIIKKK